MPVMAKTPTPTPIPTPASSPVFFAASERKLVGTDVDVGLVAKLEVDPEADPESMFEDVVLDDVLVDDLAIPIVSARKTRFSMAQHASEVIFRPQQKLPSVEQRDIAAAPFDDPPFCFS